VQRFYGSLPPLSGWTARIVTRECKFVSGKPQRVQVGARRINHARRQDAERPSDRPGSLQAALVFMCQNRHISDALLNIKTTRRVVHALPSFAAAAPSIKHTNAPRAVSLAPTRVRARVCDFRCARVLEGGTTGSLIALGGYFVVCAARGGPFFVDGTGRDTSDCP